jgi:dephospho-CoA kinase
LAYRRFRSATWEKRREIAGSRPRDGVAALGYRPGVLLIGLTGGIGAGKSSVSAALARRGAVIVDADAIVRELQQPGTDVFDAMVARFGPGIVAEDGSLDRAAVASVVFTDADALADLGAIVHPRTQEEILRRVAEQEATDHVVVLDIPLLAESGWPDLRGTIVVDLDPEVAIRRLVAHRGFDEQDARNRIANQAARHERLEHADFVVDNHGDPEGLEREVDRAWDWIQTLR